MTNISEDGPAPKHVCFPRYWERVLRSQDFSVHRIYCKKTHCSIEDLAQIHYDKNAGTVESCSACSANYGLFSVFRREHSMGSCVFREIGDSRPRTTSTSRLSRQELGMLYH